jgi:hypothetical protein
MLVEHSGFRDRTSGVGVLSRETALHFGVTGLAARASGVRRDFRIQHPFGPYSDSDVQALLQGQAEGGLPISISVEMNGDVFSPGDRLELSVYWYTSGAIPYGYSSFVHVSNGGPPLAQADKLNPADRPTKEWTPAGYIRDDYAIILPPTMPPGMYQLFVGLYTCETRPAGDCGNGERLPVTDAAGQAVGDAVPLTQVEVR